MASTSKFHNVSDEDLADRIGETNARVKLLQAEETELKDELKERGKSEISGRWFVVTVSEQTSVRLDTKKVRAALGSAAKQYEVTVTSSVVRIGAAVSNNEEAVTEPTPVAPSPVEKAPPKKTGTSWKKAIGV